MCVAKSEQQWMQVTQLSKRSLRSPHLKIKEEKQKEEKNNNWCELYKNTVVSYPFSIVCPSGEGWSGRNVLSNSETTNNSVNSKQHQCCHAIHRRYHNHTHDLIWFDLIPSGQFLGRSLGDERSCEGDVDHDVGLGVSVLLPLHINRRLPVNLRACVRLQSRWRLTKK